MAGRCRARRTSESTPPDPPPTPTRVTPTQHTHRHTVWYSTHLASRTQPNNNNNTRSRPTLSHTLTPANNTRHPPSFNSHCNSEMQLSRRTSNRLPHLNSSLAFSTSVAYSPGSWSRGLGGVLPLKGTAAPAPRRAHSLAQRHYRHPHALLPCAHRQVSRR